ncbi:MAG: HAMP domain-containing sensor histidine kinase [Ignavibacteriaceae bacterium]
MILLKNLMINLVPEWALEQPEFWDAIRRRNLWLIMLRYVFVVMLCILLFFSIFIFKIKFTETQLLSVFAITAAILAYNIILHWLREHIKLEVNSFNPLYLSLIQMILDLSALLLLVYFTGGIESPLYMLFIFQMIIGSLILPGAIVYTIAVIFVLLFIIMISLEYSGVLVHYPVIGLLDFHLYNQIYFIAAFFSTFAFMIFGSIYLSNGIARQLYKREKDLVESIKKINVAEREKQKYIMGIVHELKTPIVAVASYIDIILQKFLGPIDETIEEKLIRAKNRTDEGIQMINDVLNISKLNLYDKFDEEDVDIKSIISGVLKRRKAYADSHLIKLHFKDERSKTDNVKGDKFLLDIVISNLVGNSIKYGVDSGNVEVTLKNEVDNIIIEVCDDGVGIPEKEIPKIFNDFYRAENVKKISTEGSGLGLSVVKKIVDRHEGLISVKSPSRLAKDKQPGSCFIVKLPFQRKEK